VIVESDGRVWVVEPKGHFGGYEHTFPKGGVSKGLTLQQTAMKEVWEESGLKVEILDTIGDFKGTTSTTRYYLAKRTGGAPWMFGEETATVNLASLDDVEKLLNVQRDKDILAVAKKKLLEKKMISAPMAIPPLTKPLIPVVAPLPPSLQGPIGLDGTPTLLVDGLKQVGGQAGSNVGGLFEASDGSRYYVKLTKSAAHAQNEVLTARLYQEAGIDVPEIRHASWNGKDAVASKIVKVDKAAGADVLSKLTGTWEGFATDAWVANWDVVGMTYDNLVVSGGKALRLDTGGGLLYRAQGVSKGVKFGNVADEIHTLRNASYNSKAASVFGSMTDAQVIKSIDRVLKIEDSQIRDIVKKYGVGSANDRVTLAEKLVARKNFLRDYRNTLAKKNGLGIWKPSTPGVVPSTPGPAVPIVPTTGPAAISPAVAAKTEADLWKEIAPIQKALYNKTALAPELVKKMEQQLADLKLQVKKVHLEGQINYLQKQIKGYEVVGTKTHGAKVKVGMLKSTLAKLQKDLAVFEKPIGVPPAAPTSPIILPQQKLTQGQMKKVNAFQKDIEDLLNNPDLQNVWGLELGSFYKIHEALLKSIATLSTQMDWKATVGQINKLETSYKIKKGFLLKKIQKAKTLPTLLPHITIPPKPLAMPQSSYDTAVAQLKLLEKDLSKSGLTLGEKGNFKNATKLWLDIIKKWETATAPTTVPSPKLPGVPAFIKGKTLVYVLKNQSALETYLDTEGARKTEAVVKFIDNWKHTYYRTYREYQKNPAAWRVSMGQNYTAAEIRQVESILKKEIEAMEAMYDILPSVESKPGETIWRGVRVAARPDAQKAYAKIRPVGSEITLKAFSSATRDSSVTASFISTDAPIIYEYRNFHKGGLYLGKYGLAGEREVLMKKGLKFRVVGHEMRRYDIFNKPVLVIIVEQI
jgi:ADP-ribose pyrophosphatase YjhB (NUDIX family)